MASIEIEPPGWAFKDHNIIIPYYISNKLRIFVMEGLEHNFHILKYFQPTDYIFIYIPWHFDEYNFNYGVKCMKQCNPNYNIDNIIFMCPNQNNMDICKKLGLQSILCNHNCFIDENKFVIKENERIYQAVLNCRPEKWKRPYLAKQVDNLAIIKGYNFRKDEYYDMTQLNPKYINNDKRLTEEEVVDMYSKSMVGMILSEKEGACYSSSEFLLCGLPVISTHSVGGRDIWYNEKNSIVCDATEDAVAASVEIAINRLKSGEFNRMEIRKLHIMQSMEHRMNMIDMTVKIFQKHNIMEDANLLFSNNFFKYNRMKCTMSRKDAIQLVTNL